MGLPVIVISADQICELKSARLIRFQQRIREFLWSNLPPNPMWTNAFIDERLNLVIERCKKLELYSERSIATLLIACLVKQEDVFRRRDIVERLMRKDISEAAKISSILDVI